MKRIVCYLIGLCCLALTAQAQTLNEKEIRKIITTAEEQNFRQVTLYICSDCAQAQAGDEVKIGLLFRILKDWNIYDNRKGRGSYLPTEIEWQLPEGCTLVRETWQTPVKLSEDSDKQGYFGYCFVVVTIRIGDRLPENFRIGARASWQVCNSMTCVPGEGNIDISLKSGKKEKTEYTTLLKKW